MCQENALQNLSVKTTNLLLLFCTKPIVVINKWLTPYRARSAEHNFLFILWELFIERVVMPYNQSPQLSASLYTAYEAFHSWTLNKNGFIYRYLFVLLTHLVCCMENDHLIISMLFYVNKCQIETTLSSSFACGHLHTIRLSSINSPKPLSSYNRNNL